MTKKELMDKLHYLDDNTELDLWCDTDDLDFAIGLTDIKIHKSRELYEHIFKAIIDHGLPNHFENMCELINPSDLFSINYLATLEEVYPEVRDKRLYYRINKEICDKDDRFHKGLFEWQEMDGAAVWQVNDWEDEYHGQMLLRFGYTWILVEYKG